MVLKFYYFVLDTQWVSQKKNEKKRQGVLKSETATVCGQIPLDNVPSRYTKKFCSCFTNLRNELFIYSWASGIVLWTQLHNTIKCAKLTTNSKRHICICI